MTRAAPEREHYPELFARIAPELLAGGGEWLAPLRQQAIEHFAESGFPTTRDEEWRYTSVAAIARVPFEAAVGVPGLERDESNQLGTAGFDQRRLVFVNGRFAPALSAVPKLEGGATITNLASLVTDAMRPSWLEKSLAQLADHNGRPFIALNTALFADGYVLHVPPRLIIEQPIECLFINVPDTSTPRVAHPRNLIVAAEASQARLLETHVTLGHGQTLANIVTEIFLAPGAVVEHVKLQDESESAFHIANLAVHQDKDASFTSRSFSFGAAIHRYDIDVRQAAVGMDCTLDGLFFGNGSQHIDHHTTVDHAKPHGVSNELYKGILDDRAVGVFNGKVLVRKDAQKTDARQSNKNLLLSKDAVIETKPQLEIFADDVKCAHGATIGQIDETALFYLRSRGISRKSARSLLIYAFASEVVDRLRSDSLRERLHQLIFRRIPGAAALESGL